MRAKTVKFMLILGATLAVGGALATPAAAVGHAASVSER